LPIWHFDLFVHFALHYLHLKHHLNLHLISLLAVHHAFYCAYVFYWKYHCYFLLENLFLLVCHNPCQDFVYLVIKSFIFKYVSNAQIKL
jgi:hypothetical protein